MAPTGGPEMDQGATGRKRGGFVALFVDRPILTLMVTIAILAIGGLSVTKMPLQLSPEGLTADTINMYVPIRRDMPPREVEERVARPLEQQLRTIRQGARLVVYSNDSSMLKDAMGAAFAALRKG